MTLQYRSSDDKLLYHKCGPSTRLHKLMAACCCPIPILCTDCADYFDITIETDYSGSIWGGVWTVGPKQESDSTGWHHCFWLATVNHDCGSGETARFYVRLDWYCGTNFPSIYSEGVWRVSIDGDPTCGYPSDQNAWWEKARAADCDMEGSYELDYTSLSGFTGTCVVSEHT